MTAPAPVDAVLLIRATMWRGDGIPPVPFLRGEPPPLADDACPTHTAGCVKASPNPSKSPETASPSSM